jgi:hypothetical protein
MGGRKGRDNRAPRPGKSHEKREQKKSQTPRPRYPDCAVRKHSPSLLLTPAFHGPPLSCGAMDFGAASCESPLGWVREKKVHGAHGHVMTCLSLAPDRRSGHGEQPGRQGEGDFASFGSGLQVRSLPLSHLGNSPGPIATGEGNKLRKEFKGPVQSRRSFCDGSMHDAGAEHGGGLQVERYRCAG